MKNPTTNKIIGYIVLFIGFILFYKGFHYPTPEDPVNGHSIPLIVFSIVLVIAAFVWMVVKVRCPHCGGILSPKIESIERCPHCGRNTNV